MADVEMTGPLDDAVPAAQAPAEPRPAGGMELVYCGRTSRGPVRQTNEDCLAFWLPDTVDAWRTHGAAAILADGVGGYEHGEVASRLACDRALDALRHAPPEQTPNQLLWRMFNAANLAVYDAGMEGGAEGRMLTTLTISLFRHNEVTIGHVGDCRVYLIQHGRIRRITSDHSYAGVQLKLGLVTVDEAAASPLRSVLTRSVGQERVIRLDYHTCAVNRGDRLVQCTDGLWCFVSEKEIHDIVSKTAADGACRRLIELAEKRGSDDNLTIQVVHVEGVERVSIYRGVRVYEKIGPSAGNELQVGQVLDDRYQVTDLISRSGMASIFKAIDLRDSRTVALKVPFAHFESDPGFYSRFRREQEIGTALHHPYILRVEPDDGGRSRPYLVMEYLEGQTLGHLMGSVRPMPAQDALRIAGRICEAIHYLHEHDVVHRDLKPENIMICNDGTIRIMDFGIAKFEGQRRLTFGGFTPAMGTPDYMAPEQVKGRRGDRRTDIYSLGAILYEMVSAHVPFDGASPFVIMNARLTGDPVAPRKWNPDLPPQVQEIILHAMSRNPADRYATALEMKRELDDPDSVRLTGRADRLEAPARRAGRRRLRIALALIAAAGLVLVLAFLFRHLRWT